MPKIKIIIVDDKAPIRDALQLLMSSAVDIEVMEMHENALHLIDKKSIPNADLILMDIDMPGISGIEAVKNIRKAGHLIPIIMLTVFEEEEKIFAAIRAGANGYLLKNSKPENIIKAIRDVHAGGASFTPIIAKKVLTFFQEPSKKEYHLTPREKEVLRGLINGKVYKTICAEMHISYETIRSHMKNIYRKIHVQSLTEAVAKAIRENIVN